MDLFTLLHVFFGALKTLTTVKAALPIFQHSERASKGSTTVAKAFDRVFTWL